MHRLHRYALALFACCLVGGAARAQGTTYVAFSAAQLQSQANLLAPGDTLIVASPSISIGTLVLSGLAGTNGAWITIRGQSGTETIIGTSATQPVVQVHDCTNLRIQDLSITSTASAPSVDGIYLPPGTISSNVIVEGCRVFGVPGNGVLSEADVTDRMSFLHCEVTGTGGSGILLGREDQIGVATSCVVRDCWIHGVGSAGGQGRGIEVRGGGSANLIERNQVHDVFGTINAVGIATFFVDVPGTAAPSDWNVIRRNALWNVQDTNPNDGFYIAEYVFAVNGVVIENNVISDAANPGVESSGIVIGPLNALGTTVRNVFVRHNTVHACERGFYLLGFNPAAQPPVVFANNLSLSETTLPSVGPPWAYRAPTGLGAIPNAAFTGNAGYGASFPASLAPLVLPVGAPSSEVVAPVATVPGLDLYPVATAQLRGLGDPAETVAVDFNGTLRGGPVDCGAYHWTQANNPGAPFLPAFPPVALEPTRSAISAATGGTAPLTLTSRAPAGSLYACGISLTGIAPLAPIPLLFDPFTLLPLDPAFAVLFSGYVGVFPGGSTTFQLNLPPVGAAAPFTVDHAAILVDPTGGLIEVTNTARVIVQ